jgi:phytoene dehydrogenase-like protein
MITSVLRGVGLAERVVFRPLDPDGYSTLIFPDFTFRVPVGWDRYRQRLLETFPDEAEKLGEVVDILRQVGDQGRRLGRGEFEMGDAATEAPDFLEWGLRPVTELFSEHGLSSQASAVLLGEQATYAVRPSRTPVAVQSGVTDHFLRGAYYPEGGGQVVAGRLIQAIRAYGGEVRTRSPVSRIRVENGRVAGVVLGRTCQEIDAEVVVSNADLKRTILELVGESHFAAETVERVRSYQMTLALFCVYLGLDIDLAARGMPNSSHFFLGTYDIEGLYDRVDAGEVPADTVAYITAATVKDPVSRHFAPEGYTNLQIMTMAPGDLGVWNVDRSPAEGGRYHRDPEYRRRKQAVMEQMIATAQRVFPEIDGHIDWKEAASPVTQERFTRSTGGTSYGIALSTNQVGPFRMGPETEIPGLFLCGASAPSGPGIAGVMRGGVIAAGAVLEVDLLKMALEGQVLGDVNRLPEILEDWDAWRESH